MSKLTRYTFDLRSRVSHEPTCRTCFEFYKAADVEQRDKENIYTVQSILEEVEANKRGAQNMGDIKTKAQRLLASLGGKP